MKNISLLVILLLPLAAYAELPVFEQARAQMSGDPESAKWVSVPFVLGKAFARDRKQLGDKFDAQLWEMLGRHGNDTEAFFQAGLFLYSEEFLFGQKARPHLALLVFRSGARLADKKAGESAENVEPQLVTLHAFAAVLSAKLGLTHEAIWHKKEINRITTENSRYRYSFPAMTEAEHDIYDRIGS